MSLEIRPVGETEVPDWVRAMRTGFLVPPVAPKDEVEIRRAGMDLARTQGAFDDGRCVGTFRSFTQRLTVPGGTAVTANAVTNVTVTPTHRRRGLLGRMMGNALRAARERGDAAATLLSAEYPIYGRFGFGPASRVTRWEVQVTRAGLDPHYAGPADGGRVDFADGGTVRQLAPALHERLRARQHGAVDRTERWWRMATGDMPQLGPQAWTEPFYALYRSPAGSVDGLLTYTADAVWEAKLPMNTATVRDLIAVSPEAERALWHFLFSIDWITRVDTGLRAPDDVLPLLLPDPRAARVTTDADYMWLRPLDVPALLEARTYACPGSLVLDVTDPDGLSGGRFALEAGPDGASCVPTSRPAELSLGVGELGALCLGDESAVRLAALGRVREDRPGAAARAELMLRTARRPWCPDMF
ncbi:GNAT family N-acetyltransferase [Streptomyces cinnamoneus]|uniref:GNAT family N-acetyltransferase n=1 Tax=Streptomyces cinnamoneus TaxID=53446 RepID=A0A2G1XK76_STRCJ|nr:GNAT family N-acetyltransferase [Streptomyces cinnamoneus]PHQ51581.1 GNAT family N-acetyltransferase [Streptomyces cinnamoneus]PPT14373.1 GNAT family N-acetyltransferase [Streptomyces cinnamoneus]